MEIGSTGEGGGSDVKVSFGPVIEHIGTLSLLLTQLIAGKADSV